MPVLVIILFVVSLWLAGTALLALGLEFVWDSIAPEFYPDMSFWVAFVAVFVLGSLLRPRVTVNKDS